MCRFFIYWKNPNKFIKNNLWNELFIKSCAFFKQSYLPKYTPKLGDNPRNYNIHGDGFGFWGRNRWDELYYKLEKPIWQDQNLEYLLKNKVFDVLFAHIRAVHPFSSSSIGYNNCHPFCYENFVFMHNGFLEMNGVQKIQIINKINQNLISFIKGTTDTELLLYWWISFYKEWMENQNGLDDIGFIFREWIKSIFLFCNEFKIDAGSLNFGLYNKNNDDIICSRALFTQNVFKDEAPSLYFKISNLKEIMIFSEPMCNKEKIYKINLENFYYLKNEGRYDINLNKSIIDKTFIFPKNMVMFKNKRIEKLYFYEI